MNAGCIAGFGVAMGGLHLKISSACVYKCVCVCMCASVSTPRQYSAALCR